MDSIEDKGNKDSMSIEMGPNQKGMENQKKRQRQMMKSYFKDTPFNDEILNQNCVVPIRTLGGGDRCHQKAIRDLAYSEKHKIIISCGFDFEVFVWNPYMPGEPIIKLDGHESPLIGVQCLSDLNCFISADSKGIIKVWNILDYNCTQTFCVPDVSSVTCMTVVPKHRRLVVCGSRIWKVFEYSRPF